MRLQCTPRGEWCCFQALSSSAPLISSQSCIVPLGLVQRLSTPSSSQQCSADLPAAAAFPRAGHSSSRAGCTYSGAGECWVGQRQEWTWRICSKQPMLCLGVCDSLSYCVLPELLPRSGVVQKGERLP